MLTFASVTEFFRDNYQVHNEGLLAELERVTVVWLVEVAPQYPEVQTIVYRFLSESAKANAEIRKALYLYNARQRYEWFVSRFP